MRTPGPGNGIITSAEGAPTQVVLAFDDNRLASMLFLAVLVSGVANGICNPSIHCSCWTQISHRTSSTSGWLR